MSCNDMSMSFDLFKCIAEQFSSCMNDYLYVYDMINDTFFISERATERFAVPGSLFNNVMDSLRQFVYPSDFPTLKNDLNEVMAGNKTEHNLRYRWLDRNGSPIWIICRGCVINDSSGKPYLLIGCINEIGRRQTADNVSGLLSGISLIETFNNSTSLPDGFMMRVGIDDFKTITERLGQDYSDRILKNTAECITRNLKDGQNVYRVAADEFLIYDTTGGTTSDAHDLFHKIRAEVDDQVESNHYKALYTVSGGIISNSDFDTISFENIIKLTDFTLNSAKKRGHNQLYYYAQDDYDAFLRRRALRLALRESVDDNFRGFELYYQPIVSVDTEQLYAAETLLRYTLKNGERIPPIEFIPILEETGLIIPVGRWVIRGAMNACREFQKTLPDFRVSVNLSYIQLMRSPIFNEILDALNESSLSPDSLIVELTESGQLDNTIAIKNMWDKLKTLGVGLAIDDFGTGYSNLGNIGNLRPDIVKLDRSFTLKALKNEYEHQLMTNIICLVHSIGLNLVVEGVETNDEQTRISSLSPDFIQGYYYSRPCPKEEFKNKFHL